MAGISMWKLLIIAGIVVMVFGTKRLSSLGSDLGGAIRDFKKSFSPEESVMEVINEQNAYPKALDAAQKPQADKDNLSRRD